MTSRERILKVLKEGTSDRVPVTLFITDEGHFLKQVYPEMDINDYIGNKFKVIDLQRELGTDINIRLWGGCVPLWLIIGGVNTEYETENWKVEKKVFKRGKSKVTSSSVKTPAGSLSQEFTISEIVPGTFYYACTTKPVKTAKDLEIIEKYEPGMNNNYPEKIKNIVSKVKKYLGNDGTISIWLPGGMFNHASHFIDLDMLYTLFLTDIDFYNRLMNYCYKRAEPFVNAITDTEIDMACFGGNTAGGFVGAKMFEEYILPYEKKFIELIKSKKIKTIYHNCGEIMALAGSYKKLGTDVVESFSPPPLLGDGDLKKAKEISDGKYIIIGNIDQVNVIKDGTPKLIRQKVKETIEAGKPGGKFILQPSDFLEYKTPIENVKAYVQAGIKFGGY